MEYYSVIKKKEMLPFATTCINLEDSVLSEISQTRKHKHCMASLTCGRKKTVDPPVATPLMAPKSVGTSRD